MIRSIFTKRKYETRNFWDLVYEWENILSDQLNIPLINESKLFDKILKGIPGLYFLQNRGRLSLCFQMGAEIVPAKMKFLQSIFGLRSKNIKSVIPCIIDFWQPKEDVPLLNKAYCNNKLVLITSAEAVEFLKNNGCTLNFRHWPLSLPDQYAITSKTRYPKIYDLAMMGRQNPLLEFFLSKYTKEHSDFTYAFKRIENGHFNYYDNTGNFVGNADTHDGYLKIMRGARCGLYATPGLDDKKGANGYNQVTPRFLELISSGCHILARYPQNPDTIFFDISKFSPSIETYEQFEQLLDKYRRQEVDMNLYSDYLSKHYTSVRVESLKKIISNIEW